VKLLRFGLTSGTPVVLSLRPTADSISEKGTINPQKTGAYHRCVWNGMAEKKFKEYARHFWSLSQRHRRKSRFPE
jgi:hypothetical protein